MSDPLILNNSIWPNHNGELGEIKVQIPSNAEDWPTGDSLVGNFVYNNGNIVGFVDTKALITNESNSTVIPYDFVQIELNKNLEDVLTITKGERCKYLNINYVEILPKGYKRLPYLESVGTPTTQYIITNVIAGDESEVVFSAAYVNDTNRIFGGGIYNKTYSYFTGIGYNGSLYIRLRTEEKSFIYTPNTSGHNFKHDVKFGKNEITVDGTVVSGASYEMPIYPVDIRVTLFREGYWHENGSFEPQYAAGLHPSRIYSYKGWREGKPIGIYVPALDPENAPCMFDLITQTPFYNEGTGDFTYPGASSQVVTSDLDETFYAKKTEHGIKRLYKVPSDCTLSKDEYAQLNGYKQLVEPPMPQNGYWTHRWTETDSQLICEWIETEAPIEETI